MGSVRCDFPPKDPNAYGKPWGARLSWNGEKMEYDFSSCEVAGKISEGAYVTIQAEPGAPVCFGIKEKYTKKSEKLFAIVGEKFGLDVCSFQEALACAKKWYYEYGIGTKLPYRKRKDPEEPKKEEEPKEKQAEPEQAEATWRRLGVLDLRSGIFLVGDPDYLHDPSQVGYENKIQLLQLILKETRDRAGSIKNKDYRDVGCFAIIDPDKTNNAEVLIKRDEATDEIKEIKIKFN